MFLRICRDVVRRLGRSVYKFHRNLSSLLFVQGKLVIRLCVNHSLLESPDCIQVCTNTDDEELINAVQSIAANHRHVWNRLLVYNKLVV